SVVVFYGRHYSRYGIIRPGTSCSPGARISGASDGGRTSKPERDLAGHKRGKLGPSAACCQFRTSSDSRGGGCDASGNRLGRRRRNPLPSSCSSEEERKLREAVDAGS